jgi:acylphosphatase
MSRRVRAIITGRVQGVSYRANAANEATRLGIVGWVKNREDGSVELEAEGPDEHIAALIKWCEVGPPAALVARVAVEDVVPTRGDTTFAITH